MKTLSKNGLVIDFGALVSKAGATVAVGNASMNARGDHLTHGGVVDRTAEQVADNYYRNNPRAVTQNVGLGTLEDEIMTPAEVMAKLSEQTGATEDVKKPRRKVSDD
jgi:uncharacterized protein with beta-barrel porin domain